jgi:hypothetical protein
MNGERGRVPVVTGDLKTEGGVLHDGCLPRVLTMCANTTMATITNPGG